ncbi:MAG TPA: FAD-binding oxidoreductase [Gammaproteobacteria bacterium]|nr:FAD-binding oxidoreductase [Gammaproteobacteria bacterium]
MTNDIVATLERLLGPGAVLTGAAAARYHVDFSHENACAPLAVVRPASTEDVAAVLRECHLARQPVVVQGGLTGLAGGATPQRGEVAISLERLVGIEELDRAAHTMTVRAGTPLQTVQQTAADAGFLFPLDLGARGSCTIGGNIATNAGGNQVIRFGMMRNLVLGLEAVLADGTVVSSMGKMLKNNAGYDLKQLFIGTEGTLGIVTRAVLRLWPKLPAKVTALCALRDLDSAIALLHRLQALGGSLSAFEAMWASYFHYVLEHMPALASPFAERHPLYVLAEIEGTDDAVERERLERALEAALAAGEIVDAAVAQSEREIRNFWSIRDAIGEVTPTLQPMLGFDISLPLDSMNDFLASLDAELERFPVPVTNLVFGHIGDNNLHHAITTHSARDLGVLCDLVYAAVGAHGGSVSAEHGVGTLRRKYLHHSRSSAELELMSRLKTALDPHGILNPNRVLPADARQSTR